jgi:hypothetical protein
VRRRLSAFPSPLDLLIAVTHDEDVGVFARLFFWPALFKRHLDELNDTVGRALPAAWCQNIFPIL